MSRNRLRILWDLYRPVRWLLLIYVVLVVIGTVVEGMALAALVPLIEGGGDEGVGGVYGRIIELIGLDVNSDISLVIVVGGLFVLRSLAQYGSRVMAGIMVRREAVRLQVELFRLYLGLRWEVAMGITQGEANLLLNGQVQRVAQFLKKCVSLLEGFIYTIGLTAVAVLVSPQHTLVAVGLIGTSAVGVTLIANRIRRHAHGILVTSKAQAGVLLQYARGIQMLRAYDVSEPAVRDVERLAVEREQMAYRSQRIEALSQVLPDLMFVLALLSVVGLAFNAGEGLAEVGAVVALLFRVSQYLKRFSEIATLSSMVPTVRDVHRYRRLFLRNAAERSGASVDPHLAPGEVVLDRVRYRYDGSPSIAVADFSNHVRPGEFIGVVGSSGSGKSTLISMIVGLLEPKAGRVRIGLRSPTEGTGGLAYVAQTPFLLKGTVASNVRWFRHIDDGQVRAACEAAGLGPLLRRLPDGIETSIAQEGLTLSGGERQRLALARALAGEPEILILDEATSSLDSESESAIQQALDNMHGSTTVIAVAHRLSTVLSADRIWVLEDGAVTEDAPPQELLRTDGSRFAELGSLQGLHTDR